MPTQTSASHPVPVVRFTFSTSVRLLTKAVAFAYASSQPGPPEAQGDGKPGNGVSAARAAPAESVLRRSVDHILGQVDERTSLLFKLLWKQAHASKRKLYSHIAVALGQGHHVRARRMFATTSFDGGGNTCFRGISKGIKTRIFNINPSQRSTSRSVGIAERHARGRCACGK
jgi:hypothetical protein